MKISIDAAKCRCKDIKLCATVCPFGLIWDKKTDAVPELIPELEYYCINCGHCEAICPTGAIKINAFEKRAAAFDTKEKIPPDLAAKLLKTRRSVRIFKKEPLPDDTIKDLMEITRWVPTASNKQQQKWIIYNSRSEIRKLAGLTVDYIKNTGVFKEIAQAWEKGEDIILRDAPHLILVLGEKDYFWSDIEAGIALTYLELYAHARNLGTCWAGFFTRAANKFPPLVEHLKLPDNQKVCGGIMLGQKVYRQDKIPFRKKPDITWR